MSKNLLAKIKENRVRHALNCRFPKSLWDQIQSEADKAGISYNDFINIAAEKLIKQVKSGEN